MGKTPGVLIRLREVVFVSVTSLLLSSTLLRISGVIKEIYIH